MDRTLFIKIRVNADEKRRAQEKAAMQGLDVSAWTRRLWFAGAEERVAVGPAGLEDDTTENEFEF
jgi:hypothetical protein